MFAHVCVLHAHYVFVYFASSALLHYNEHYDNYY